MRILLLVFCCIKFTYGQPVQFAVYSSYVNDSFDITVHLPYHTSGEKLNAVYYLDANLYSGKKMQEEIYAYSEKLKDVIFIGIANRGRTEHRFRKRDYIPPVLRKGDTLPFVKGRSKHYGHADRFHSFMQYELLPLIERKYNADPVKRTIIGHSLGGLFVFYSLFKPERIFNQFVSLSPGLWVNKYNIFEYEKAITPEFDSAYLYLSAGKREVFNFILSGNRKMYKRLKKRNFSGLIIDYAEHKRLNHHNQVQASLSFIFQKLFQIPVTGMVLIKPPGSAIK